MTMRPVANPPAFSCTLRKTAADQTGQELAPRRPAEFAEIEQTPAHANSGEALVPLRRLHEHLAAQKQVIEAEIARVDALKTEQETVTAQMAALIPEMLQDFWGSRSPS